MHKVGRFTLSNLDDRKIDMFLRSSPCKFMFSILQHHPLKLIMLQEEENTPSPTSLKTIQSSKMSFFCAGRFELPNLCAKFVKPNLQ